jgi:cytochrome c oxidase assembly protein subunit 15
MVAAPLSFKAAISAPTGREEHVPLRPVRQWLLALIVLVFTMVLVGGATRLTESGLSITEWNLVSGTLPPLSEEGWQAEFELYRQIPQYELLKPGMSLQDFKTIYWWEWAHRELGRFIGLVYIAGFAQGIVGWIMVASGLQPGMTAVAPVKLTLHLVLASLFFAALTATFVRLGGAEREVVSPTIKGASGLLVLLAFVQIALGGLTAGHDAGLTYNTWPLMDGRFVPRGLALLDPWWLNVFDNVATIQFNHRLGAYVIGAAILAYALAARSQQTALRERALIMIAFVLVQITLGIAVLLVQVPPMLALTHQGLALILLFVLVWNAATLRIPSPA